MWLLEFTEEYVRRSKKYARKLPREHQAVHSNLDRCKQALDCGARPKQVTGGWIHPEPMDVLALTEKGGGKKEGGKNKGKGLRPLRLYIYPEEPTEVIHVITLGDKATQNGDIQYCKEYVRSLSAEEN